MKDIFYFIYHILNLKKKPQPKSLCFVDEVSETAFFSGYVYFYDEKANMQPQHQIVLVHSANLRKTSEVFMNVKSFPLFTSATIINWKIFEMSICHAVQGFLTGRKVNRKQTAFIQIPAKLVTIFMTNRLGERALHSFVKLALTSGMLWLSGPISAWM